MEVRFRDRTDAGRQLAGSLERYSGRDDTVVLALPRGGLPVGVEIARRLDAPLDVFPVRKLGVPGHEELAFGAIASGNVIVLNERVVEKSALSDGDIKAVIERESVELVHREDLYRQQREPTDVGRKIVILVDDGLATGATMRAAVKAIANRGAAKIVVAVPVAATPPLEALREEVDDVVCVLTPPDFLAVGVWYGEFPQLTDGDVIQILREADRWRDDRRRRSSAT